MGKCFLTVSFYTCILAGLMVVPELAYGQCHGDIVWHDEFNGSTLDTSKWSYNTGNGCPDLCGWGNNELQYYTDRTENVRVENGNLIIEARRENYEDNSFTSGRLLTRDKFEHTYGRFEARIRMPEGAGIWPAFWMLRHDNSWPMTGEIDIMEYRGDQPQTIHGTLHYGDPYPDNQYDGTTYEAGMNLASEFHTYAVEWEPGEIRWYFDDVLFKTETRNPNSLDPASANDPWPWEEDFYIIMNLAVGGNFTNITEPANVNLVKNTLEVDYVRVYNMKVDSANQSAYNGLPVSLPGKVEAEKYDEGCPGAAYADNDPGNQGGAFRSDGVDIEATADPEGGNFHVGYTEAGEFLEYTVDVADSGNYDFEFRVSSAVGGGSFDVLMDGAPVIDSVQIPNTGAWDSWQTVTVNDVHLSEGEQVMRVRIDSGEFNINYIGVSSDGLPTGLMNSEAIPGQQGIVLRWMASLNTTFTVEHSVNGVSWDTVRIVEGKQGSTPHHYKAIHEQPADGDNYYRICYSNDDEQNCSRVLQSGGKSLASYITVAPNPAPGVFHVDIVVPEHRNKITIEIRDIYGRLVERFRTGKSQSFSMGEDWSSGVYWMNAISYGKVYQEKLIKR